MYNNPSSGAAPAGSGGLAYTGTNSITAALVVAVSVLLIGATLALISRRRQK